MSRINSFLELVVNQGGSDLHLVTGKVPHIRMHGDLHKVRFRELSTDDMERLLEDIMPEAAKSQLGERLAVDFGYDADELGRFRVNVYRHTDGLAAAFRVIPAAVPTCEELGLPPVLAETIEMPSGLTLVTGPTGSGKSTTLAALVDHINRTRKGHVITIEDPIEFRHEFKSCRFTQREVGTHTPSFEEALKNALREDPDCILVGELRDLETMSLAMTAAETGIQVLGTLHTNGAVRTIDRFINVFPARAQGQVATMLAEGLRMVVSQQLVPNSERSGRLAVFEIMIKNDAVSSMIRSRRAHQLQSQIQSSRREGMQSLDSELERLVLEGKITAETAFRHAIEKSKFQQQALLQGAEGATGG